MLPFVSVSVPITVVVLPSATTPEPLMVRLFTFPVNTEAGSASPLVLVNAMVALALLASIAPLDLVTEAPAIVNALAPTVSVPLVRASVPLTTAVVPPPLSETPVELLMVRLLNVKDAAILCNAEPLKVMVLPVVT